MVNGESSVLQHTLCYKSNLVLGPITWIHLRNKT